MGAPDVAEWQKGVVHGQIFVLNAHPHTESREPVHVAGSCVVATPQSHCPGVS